MKRFLSVIYFFSFSIYLQAQQGSYPQNYFRNPMNIPIDLTANFGELRPDHWHMGLDIRTNQKENIPVFASAQGYVAHIGIRPKSFGRFIVINHPNGLSTLYAHLNDFNTELEKFVKEQQYLKESWAIELDIQKDRFPVTKGQFIALSGNSGGSQGPHLHFEIFDTKSTKRLNPLLFGFSLQDKLPPNLIKIGMYDRSVSVYEKSPVFFQLKNTNLGYIIPKMPVIKTGLKKISFAIQTYDVMKSGGSANGIYSAELFVDEKPQISFTIDSIDYEETVYMNAHIDYKSDYYGGAYLQHLSQLPGDKGNVYKQINSDGVIQLSDTNVHAVSIRIKDAFNNSSQLNFSVQYDENLVKEIETLMAPFFIYNYVNVFEKPDFEMFLPEGCLYDNISQVYFRTTSALPFAVSALHLINDASTPVHNNFTVRIKPSVEIPEEWKNKLLLIRSSKENTVKKAVWQGEWLSAKFGGFGGFQVVADFIPPSINELGIGDTINLSAADRILFAPRDNYGIKKFRAELNGQWLNFSNDKGKNWIYKFDEHCPYGIHKLNVLVEDIAGNITEKTWWFKRNPYSPLPPAPKKKTVKKVVKKKK
jgi:hypothetical protein